jgi:hypothetical protein
MASFTDAISQFNPYVKQLPIEAMAQVGMYKQQQYDQGVQKIQSYIDNVAGMEVYRPQDKQYLQSKLNELTSNLRTVAAADFSNQQIVNSVGGMTSTIIKDPYIQSAVYSTSRIKKQNQIMEEAQKKGELTPENKFLYERSLNSYAQGKLGETFNGQYVPYTDVLAKLRDVAKSVGVDESVIPDLFGKDAKGNVILNKVMAERHLKGKSAEKLLDAFNSALTPQDKQQLAITGIYENRNMTPEQLSIATRSSYNQHISTLETQLERINVQLDLTSDSESSEEQKAILLKSRQNIQDTVTKLQKQRDEAGNLDYIANNEDSIKANLYSNNWLISAANQMKEVSDITEYKINPWFDVMMKENDYNLKLKQENRQAREFNILRQEHATDKAEDSAKWRLDYYGKYGQFPEEVGKKPKTNILAPIDEKDYEGLKSQFEGGYSDDVDAQNELSQKLALQFLRSRNPNLSDEQLMKQVEKWTGDKEGSKTAMMNRFAGHLMTAYDKNARDVPSKFHGQIEALKILNDAVDSKGEVIRTIDKQAKEEAARQGLDIKEYENVLDKINPVTLTFPEGKAITIPKQDIADFAKLIPQQFNILSGLSVDVQQKDAKAVAEKRLINKYGINYQRIKDRLVNEQSRFGGLATFISPHIEVTKAGNLLHNSIFDKVSKIKGEFYANSDLIPRKMIEPVKLGTDNSEIVSGNINAVIAKYQTMPNLDPSFDYETAMKVANGDKAKTYFEIGQVGDKMQYTMVTSSKEGTSRAIVEPSDYTAITGKPIHSTTELDPMFLKLNTAGTTAKPNGLPWFSGRAFPLLKDTKYKGVTGNLVTDELDPNKVWFELNIPGKSKPITYPDPIDHPGGLSKKDPIDGSLNTNLKYLSTAISAAEIDALLQKNKK